MHTAHAGMIGAIKSGGNNGVVQCTCVGALGGLVHPKHYTWHTQKASRWLLDMRELKSNK